ncbi:acetyl-CoA carboxylase biotin carboxyl carrier protein [Parapedobacter tibetensis]|uniref:acetyl-CoA carboxylase biotin carboxyl carrier protein n=1 Tax=Parapedobacter tibetensis TaxID=2972951 RepID=UPI00214D3496|nr:acetyl-CoA carboxylase biotin carboxyl carrier protein [Parapedobacter tibetensis]
MSMDIKQVQDLIKFVAKSGVNEVSIEEKDFKITIKTTHEPTYVTATIPAPTAPPAPQTVSTAVEVPPPATTKAEDTSHYVTIKSPMIGTFYRSSSPDKPVFVNIGDEITAGKVVCIVEAMKLFNEIESEVSGKIVKVLVDDAQPVEYDQPLFLVEPK